MDDDVERVARAIYRQRGSGSQAVSATPEQIAERLEKALLNIAGEAPAKEPRDQPTVGWPPNWSAEYCDEVNDMVQEAFNEGHARACWELGQIADAALKAAP